MGGFSINRRQLSTKRGLYVQVSDREATDIPQADVMSACGRDRGPIMAVGRDPRTNTLSVGGGGSGKAKDRNAYFSAILPRTPATVIVLALSPCALHCAASMAVR